jgi:cell division protease FtsH
MALQLLDSWSKRRRAFSAGFFVFALGVLGLLRAGYGTALEPELVSWTELVALSERGQINEAWIGPTRIVAVTAEPRAGGQPAARVVAERVPGTDDGAWIERMRLDGVALRGQHAEPRSWARPLLRWWLPIALLAGAYWLGLRRLERRVGPLRLGRGRLVLPDRRAAREQALAELAGMDEAKAELVELAHSLVQLEPYRRLGATLPHVLLAGEPGTGKSSLVHAVAREADLPLFEIAGAEFVQTFMGAGAAPVQELLARVRERAPCILFIDDLDFIQRAASSTAGAAREAALEQLLLELERREQSAGVVVVAAASEPSPTWTRPGRFDRLLLLQAPDAAAREAILRSRAGRLRCAPDVDLRALAQRTAGLVGGDLAQLLHEAGRAAARRRAPAIAGSDLDTALAAWQQQEDRRRRDSGEQQAVAAAPAPSRLAAIS